MQIVVTFDSFEEFDAFRGSGQSVKTTKSRKQAKEDAPVEATVTEEAPVEEAPVKEEAPAAEEAPTMEEVRAVLGKLQKAGRRDEVKKLLNSVGAEKLPEVDPKHYAELIQKAGELDA